jgi:hypothetical protein
MPVYRLLQYSAFEPEDLKAMAVAFEQALSDLRLADRTDPLAEQVARKVIEFAQRGVRNPIRLRQRAVAAFSGVTRATAGKRVRRRAMYGSREFREFAQQCVCWAEDAKNDRQRQMLLDLAEQWTQAALAVERSTAFIDDEAPLVPNG